MRGVVGESRLVRLLLPAPLLLLHPRHLPRPLLPPPPARPRPLLPPTHPRAQLPDAPAPQRPRHPTPMAFFSHMPLVVLVAAFADQAEIHSRVHQIHVLGRGRGTEFDS